MSYIVEHSGASVLLLAPDVDESLAKVTAAHRIVLGASSHEALLRPGREPAPWADSDEDATATATVNYTSGTTARPKGVQLTHRNIYLNALTFGLHAGICDRDVYLHTLPMFHANGWGMPWVVAGLGVRQIVLRKIDGAEILRRVETHGVTVMCAPPTRTIERVEAELGWEFIQIYGLTETSPLLTINRSRAEYDGLPAEERAGRLSRAGAPALGVRLRLADDGEVLARSNVILAGYWANPGATEDALRDDWFHTGDGGEIDDDGYLTIRDRKKDVIIAGGENVSSIEVEDAIYQHPGVAEVAVIGVPHDRWGETVKALIVRADGADVDEAEIIAHCKERLAGYKAPTSVEFPGSIPRTATGKVQKFKLREPYWRGRDREIN